MRQSQLRAQRCDPVAKCDGSRPHGIEMPAQKIITLDHRHQRRGQIVDRLRIEQLRDERPRLIGLSVSRQYSADNGLTSYGPPWIDSMTRLVRQLRDIAPHGSTV